MAKLGALPICGWKETQSPQITSLLLHIYTRILNKYPICSVSCSPFQCTRVQYAKHWLLIFDSTSMCVQYYIFDFITQPGQLPMAFLWIYKETPNLSHLLFCWPRWAVKTRHGRHIEPLSSLALPSKQTCQLPSPESIRQRFNATVFVHCGDIFPPVHWLPSASSALTCLYRRLISVCSASPFWSALPANWKFTENEHFLYLHSNDFKW